MLILYSFAQPSIIRLGVLLLLFDVYLTWARIEKQIVPGDAISDGNEKLGQLAQQPIVVQYLFFRTYTLPEAGCLEYKTDRKKNCF
jgi:hypothetical protein